MPLLSNHAGKEYETSVGKTGTPKVRVGFFSFAQPNTYCSHSIHPHRAVSLIAPNMTVLPVVPTLETYEALWALWPTDNADSTSAIIGQLAQLGLDPISSSSDR
jgi:hypothetical protein